MADNDLGILESLPEVLQPIISPIVKQTLACAPPDVQRELLQDLEAIHKLTTCDPTVYSNLIGMVKRLASPAMKPATRISIAGAVSVGKSTLFNALLSGTGEHAETSPVPGTTKVNQTAAIGLFSLADTPGADHGASAGSQERLHAFEAYDNSDFIIVVFDATRGITTSDSELFTHIKELKKPFVIALNKIDAISAKDRTPAINACAYALDIPVEHIVPISAEKKQGVEQLLLVAAAYEPRLLTGLGKNIPELREKLAWQAVRRSAITSGVMAVVPVPFVDLVGTSGVQIALVSTIAKIYNNPVSKKRAVELSGAISGNLLGRKAMQELAKLGGPAGWAISASIAAATTMAIGYSNILWFSKGAVASPEDIKAIGKKIQASLLQIPFFKSRKKPTSQSLSQELEAPVQSLTQKLATGQLSPDMISQQDTQPSSLPTQSDSVDNAKVEVPEKEAIQSFTDNNCTNISAQTPSRLLSPDMVPGQVSQAIESPDTPSNAKTKVTGFFSKILPRKKSKE